MTVSLRAPVARSPKVAVHVHGVEHHRHVAQPQPHPLALTDLERVGLVEGLAVDRPAVAGHRPTEDEVVRAVDPLAAQPDLGRDSGPSRGARFGSLEGRHVGSG